MKGVKEKSKTAHFGPKMTYFPHFEHNKRLISKILLHHIFLLLLHYFKKKKKSDKGFLRAPRAQERKSLFV